MGLASSALLIMIALIVPDVALYGQLADLVKRVDFQKTVMNGMLAFLLFAGSLHVEFTALRARIAVIGAMAVVGTILSAVLIGLGIWACSPLLAIELPLASALVFGALISPTDPVAVLASLRTISVPSQLETDLSGESLFNDGIGVVLFTALLAVASATDAAQVGATEIGELFLLEAAGGAVLGLICGYLAYLAMRAVDDYPVEVLISIALAMGCYSLASAFHASGPIAVVVAGIFVGIRGPKDALSDLTQRYLFRLLDARRSDLELDPISAHRPWGSRTSVRRELPADLCGHSHCGGREVLGDSVGSHCPAELVRVSSSPRR